MYFKYGETELKYLKQKDKKLAEVMEAIGMIERQVDTDLFFFRGTSHYRTADFYESAGDDMAANEG